MAVRRRDKGLAVLLLLSVVAAANLPRMIKQSNRDFIVCALSPSSNAHMPVAPEAERTAVSSNPHLAGSGTESPRPTVSLASIGLTVLVIIIVAVAVTIGKQYRAAISAFFAKALDVVGPAIAFVCGATAILCYLYCLYRGGQALFRDGDILRAVLLVAVIGPAVSGSFWLLFLGVFMLAARMQWREEHGRPRSQGR